MCAYRNVWNTLECKIRSYIYQIVWLPASLLTCGMYPKIAEEEDHTYMDNTFICEIIWDDVSTVVHSVLEKLACCIMIFSWLYICVLSVLAVASDMPWHAQVNSSAPWPKLDTARYHSGYIPFVVPVLVFAELLCTRGDVEADMHCTTKFFACCKHKHLE